MFTKEKIHQKLLFLKKYVHIHKVLMKLVVKERDRKADRQTGTYVERKRVGKDVQRATEHCVKQD